MLGRTPPWAMVTWPRSLFNSSSLRMASSKLEDFSSQVLKDGSEVDGSAGTDTLSVVALAEETVDTTNGECETSLGRAAKKR